MVGRKLDQQFGRFLREKRGTATFAQFARRLGISTSTLYRLENGDQSITLQLLEQVLDRLKVSLTEVFGEDQ